MWKSVLEEIWQVRTKFESENLKKKFKITSSQWTYEGEKII